MEPRQYAVMASNMEYHILEMMLSDNSLNMLYDMKVLPNDVPYDDNEEKDDDPTSRKPEQCTIYELLFYTTLLEKMEGDR